MEDASILRALEKYADLLGELRDSDERSAKLREDLGHTVHVIRLYRKDWTGDGVKPRRPSSPSRYLRHGSGLTTALDVLRDAQRPITVREIVLAVMGRLSIPSSPGAIKSLESSLRYCLAKRVGDGVKEAGRRPVRFVVFATSESEQNE